jgi:excisionase family DNA binding protein
MTKRDDESEPLMTVSEVAADLKASEKTVRRRIAAGELPVIRDGRMIRIRPKDYRRYLISKLVTTQPGQIKHSPAMAD